MATLVDGAQFSWWDTPDNTSYLHITGDISRSGNTVTVSNIVMWLTFRYSSSYGGGYRNTASLGGASTSLTWNFSGNRSDDHALNSFSFTAGASETSHTLTFSMDGDNYSFNIGFPSGVNPPSGLSMSNFTSTPYSVSATVAITDWGTSSVPAEAYRELNISTTGDDSIRRFQKVYGSTKSGTITVNNSSEVLGGMDISPNTHYYAWEYVTNGTLSSRTSGTGSQVVTVAALDTASVSAGQNSATITIKTLADGNYYSKNIQYSLNSGAWTTGTTVSSGSATTKTFTISSLIPGTQYTVKLRVNTTAGNYEWGTLTFTTTGSATKNTLYASVSSKTKKISKMHCSVSGKTKRVIKLYASVNGKTKRIL